MNKFKSIFLLIFVSGIFIIKTHAQEATLNVQINHFANGKKIQLNDSTYFTALREAYQIKRLKYYLSRPGFTNDLKDTAFLIDAFSKNIFELNVRSGTFNEFNFTLGIDSIMQSTGAQTGALDVMNGMFWTWNSGYINFKLEGYADSSAADLNRIEHHIGGYRQPFATDKKINISFEKPFKIKPHKKYELVINFNLDEYFNRAKTSLIKTHPLIMSSGLPAFEIAENFTYLFSFEKIREL